MRSLSRSPFPGFTHFRRVIFVLLLSGLLPTLWGQEPDRDPPPSATQLEEIKSKSLALLKNIVPHSTLFESSRPLKMLETSKGTIRWGNLFEAGEVSALVNLPPEGSLEFDNHPPQYLCFFTWTKGQWVFRQFLGNAYDLEIHYRKDIPRAYLQGSYREGRFDGGHLSWFYDAKSRSLKRTYFEDWGPFHLAGNYLICTRGFERLAHDDTKWIYSYEKGSKGKLIAIFHGNDSGYFDIVFQNPDSGKIESWHFKPDLAETHIAVEVHEGVLEDDGMPPSGGREGKVWKGDLTQSLSPEYCFTLLTGLNPFLLGYGDEQGNNQGDAWLDKLPAETPLKRTPIKATGDSKIVNLFQWPKGKRNESK